MAMGNNVGMGDSVVTDLPKLRDGSEWYGGRIREEDGTIIEFDDSEPILVLSRENTGVQSAYASDVLALIDANGLNTTANELRNRATKALEMAHRFGGIDGDHHKAWVIDQMVRALTGDGYDEFVRDAKVGDDGPETYDWDCGIAP